MTRNTATIFTTTTPIFFNQLLISMNMYQHAKNQALLLFCSRDIVNLKTLQSRTFWPISQKLDFSKVLNTKNNINFLYRPNLEKINDQIFQYIKITLLLAHFPHFWGKTFFSKNLALPHTTPHGPWHHAEFQKNVMNQLQEDFQTGGWKDGRTEGQKDRTFNS